MSTTESKMITAIHDYAGIFQYLAWAQAASTGRLDEEIEWLLKAKETIVSRCERMIAKLESLSKEDSNG